MLTLASGGEEVCVPVARTLCRAPMNLGFSSRIFARCAGELMNLVRSVVGLRREEDVNVVASAVDVLDVYAEVPEMSLAIHRCSAISSVSRFSAVLRDLSRVILERVDRATRFRGCTSFGHYPDFYTPNSNKGLPSWGYSDCKPTVEREGVVGFSAVKRRILALKR